MSALLLDEQLLCYQPALVRRLGLAEAAIVQQLHYWSRRATNSHDGHIWVYKTYADWADEIGLSAKAIRGALERLRKAGVVVGIQSPLDARDRTLWWRIDHDVLEQGSPSAPEGSPPSQRGSSRAPVPDAVQRLRTETGEGERALVRDDVRAIFDAWLEATQRDPARTKLTPDRRRCIAKAVASHGVDDCLAAVRHIGADDWARGNNDRRTRFDDVQHALGNTERIERWRDQQPRQAVVTPIRRTAATERMERYERRKAAFLRSQQEAPGQ